MISFCIITLLLAPLMWVFGKMYFHQDQIALQARTSFEREFASSSYALDNFGIESGARVDNFRVPSTVPLVSFLGKWVPIRCHRVIGGVGLIATSIVLLCGGVVCFLNGHQSTAVVRIVDGKTTLEWLQISDGNTRQP